MLMCWVLNIYYYGLGNLVKVVFLWVCIIVLQWFGYIFCVGKLDGSLFDILNIDFRYY